MIGRCKAFDMSFPSKPNHADNDWIDRNIEPFKNWCYSRQPKPDMSDFEVWEDADGVRFSIREATIRSIAASTAFRLQIISANEGGVGKARVRLGKMAGRLASSGMTDPGDDPPYIITFGSTAGWKYIYADVTMEYDMDEGTWSATACQILHTSTIPANTATHIYVEIGQVKLESVTGGYAITSIIQTVTGDQWVARISGQNSPYVDAHGH